MTEYNKTAEKTERKCNKAQKRKGRRQKCRKGVLEKTVSTYGREK